MHKIGRREFLAGATAVAAAATMPALPAASYRSVTVTAAAWYEGKLWCVFSDLPQTIVAIAGHDLKVGDVILVDDEHSVVELPPCGRPSF